MLEKGTSKNTFEIGSIYEGVVVSIKKYGVFLSFVENYVGILHISEISKNYINNIERYFSIGDKVNCMVTSIDKETKFLQVSLKRMDDDLNPYSQIKSSKKVISYIKKIDFSKLEKQLPQLIKEELIREKEDELKS